MEEHLVEARGRRRTFAALAYPNDRLWFFGHMTSRAGTWMQSAAQGGFMPIGLACACAAARAAPSLRRAV
jgi:hypothetical protein